MSKERSYWRGPGSPKGQRGSSAAKPASDSPKPSKPVITPPSCLDSAGLALLDQGLAAIDQRLALPGLKQDLIRYVRELELWNPRLGLVEASGPDLITRHLLDCLAAVPALLERLEAIARRSGSDGSASFHLADIGSGAGLPGVLLLLALKHISARPVTMTLVEKQQRRVGFLLNVKALLALANLEVCQESLETVSARETGRFDLVTARAFRPLEPDIVREMGRLLQANGELFLFKGRKDRIDEELRAAGLGSSQITLVQLKVPGLEEERHIVVIAAHLTGQRA